MATPHLGLVLVLVCGAGGEENEKRGGGGLGSPFLEATRVKELSVSKLLGEREGEGGGAGESSLGVGEAGQSTMERPDEHSLYHGEDSDLTSGEPSDHLRDESHPLVTLLETSPHTMKLLIRPWSYRADTMVGSDG